MTPDSPRPGVPPTPVGAPPVLDPIDPVDPGLGAPATAAGSTAPPITPGTRAGGGDPGGTASQAADAGKHVAGTAADAGKNVAGTAADAGKNVAGTAQDQAGRVAGEAAQQARNLIGQTREELRSQAATQQQKVADGVRSLADDLASMADNSERSGSASDIVREASQRSRQVAEWLDGRDAGGLLDDVRTFARRRPGAFLALAAGAGLIAGRLTRGAVDEARDDSPPSGGSVSPAPDYGSADVSDGHARTVYGPAGGTPTGAAGSPPSEPNPFRPPVAGGEPPVLP